MGLSPVFYCLISDEKNIRILEVEHPHLRGRTSVSLRSNIRMYQFGDMAV